MKNHFILFLFLLSLIGNSQTDSTKVAFVSYWSVGDSYDFNITKITKKWDKDNQVKEDKKEYQANFTVVDSTADSYTIRWSYANELKKNYQIPDELAEKFAKYSVTEIIYKTSEVGDFVELVNWKEISKNMQNMFGDLIAVLGKEDKNLKKQLEEALNPMLELYNSKEGIESLVLKELQYFHYPMGVEFDYSEPFLYDDELPNLLGGEPIKGKGKLTFTNVNLEEGFCIMKQELTLDPEDTKKLILDVFKRMNIESN
ncbi:MAG: hypothetical protein KDC50_02835, partial [Flavobacterium sp.]|nr:hypothetical protein [Flavobacterium sp.]